MVNKIFMKSIRILTILVSLLFIANNLQYSTAYWGDGDSNCMEAHGIGEISGTYVSDPNIIIDGVDNETIWDHEDVENYIVAMANNHDSDYFFVSYMELKFIYDDTNLYIRAMWNDTTVDGDDMFFICWDMNCSDYSAYMFIADNSMETPNPGETVDSWQWRKFNVNNNTVGTLLDDSFNYDGWVSYSEERESDYGFTYGDLKNDGTNYYQLEIRRPLSTTEQHNDVQFKEDTPVRFTASVCNAYRNDEHAISWTQQLTLSKNLVGEDDKNGIIGYQSLLLFLTSSLSLVFILYKQLRQNKSSI